MLRKNLESSHSALTHLGSTQSFVSWSEKNAVNREPTRHQGWRFINRSTKINAAYIREYWISASQSTIYLLLKALTSLNCLDSLTACSKLIRSLFVLVTPRFKNVLKCFSGHFVDKIRKLRNQIASCPAQSSLTVTSSPTTSTPSEFQLVSAAAVRKIIDKSPSK